MSGPTRRDVLAGAVGLAAAPLCAMAAGPVALRAAPMPVRLLPGRAPATDLWTYDGLVPGPEIRLPRGGGLARRFVNDLPQGSSVHWHGIRLPNAMDGVAGLTQPAVEAGAAFDYAFTVPDAGTYWYHPHNRTFEQMARGLYGPLIVEEPDPPEVDAELVLVLDDWRIDRDGALAGNFGDLHDMSHAGRIGNWVTVNGISELKTPAGSNARLRLRLINAANARIFRLGLKGLTGWIMALDGMPLAAPQAADRVVLAPAQRADLIVDVVGPDEGVVYSIERDGGYALASFPVAGTRRPARLAAPRPLPPNDVAVPGPLAAARVIEMPIAGGAMGRMRSARLDGRLVAMRELVDAGMVWAMAGTAGMPEAPLATLVRGETVRIVMANDTVWPHAMHLHGHHFREVRPAEALGPLRDTLLVNPEERREIIFVADNPGDWLLHCHMLEHAASGMMTWLRVS